MPKLNVACRPALLSLKQRITYALKVIVLPPRSEGEKQEQWLIIARVFSV